MLIAYTRKRGGVNMKRALANPGLLYFYCILCLITSKSPAAPEGAPGCAGETGRRGALVLQFDDSFIDHYDYAFPILEQYHCTGSFGIITGTLGTVLRMTRAQVIEMHGAGHEIHDHTLYHDADFWADPANAPLWPVRIEQSLAIFAEMGLTTRGWNQPGGTGDGWSNELRDALCLYYDYAAGRILFEVLSQSNFHWNLKDDPYSLGRGKIYSWGYNAGANAIEEVANIITKIADGIAQGLVAIPVFHRVLDIDSTAWALEQICLFASTNNLCNVKMEDAVYMMQLSHEFIDSLGEQIPNPEFEFDLDGNGRPDGWYYDCCYAPPEMQQQISRTVVQIKSGVCTTLYGPEPGETQFSFFARTADCNLTPKIDFTMISLDAEYRYSSSIQTMSYAVRDQWQLVTIPLDIAENIDRVTITFAGLGTNCLYIASPSWRTLNGIPALSELGSAFVIALIVAIGISIMHKRGRDGTGMV